MRDAKGWILLGGALLGMAGCDGVSAEVEVKPTEKPSQPTPSVPAVDTVSRVVLDSTLLPGDTTQQVVATRWKGSVLVGRDTAVVPVTRYSWLVNRYGEPVVLEAWTGDSLEWRNGYVLGKGLQALPDAQARSAALPEGGRRRLSARWRKEILVVAGVQGTQGVQFLASGRFLSVAVGDTLYLDRQGSLQRRP